jgi:hypothetical protein
MKYRKREYFVGATKRIEVWTYEKEGVYFVQTIKTKSIFKDPSDALREYEAQCKKVRIKYA